MFRRIIYGLIAVTLIDYPAFQLDLTVLVSLGVAMFIAYIKPYERKIINFMETFNEMCFIGLTITFYAFTEQY